jgi:hypothetical protein
MGPSEWKGRGVMVKEQVRDRVEESSRAVVLAGDPVAVHVGPKWSRA